MTNSFHIFLDILYAIIKNYRARLFPSFTAKEDVNFFKKRETEVVELVPKFRKKGTGNSCKGFHQEMRAASVESCAISCNVKGSFFTFEEKFHQCYCTKTNWKNGKFECVEESDNPDVGLYEYTY